MGCQLTAHFLLPKLSVAIFYDEIGMERNPQMRLISTSLISFATIE